MVVTSSKPVVRPEYLKGQIVPHKGHLYESLQRPDGSYFWHLLSTDAAIDEGGMSVYRSDEDTGRYLKAIFLAMRNDPNYRYSNLDYDSFHENRARFPLLWNEFLKLHRNRRQI